MSKLKASADGDLPARFREIRQYWDARRKGDALPARADLDPLDIARHLPYLSLIDVLRDKVGRLNYRYRLIGTAIVERMGADYTGKTFDAFIEPEQLTQVMADYAEAAEGAVATLSSGKVPVRGKDFLSYDRLLLPLASDSVTVDMLVAVFEFNAPD